MKALTLSALAASIALAMPAYADDTHHPAQAGATPGTTTQPDGKSMQAMQDNLTKMRGQLDRLGKAKTADERQKIMAEYMQSMQDGMGMARGMQTGMGGCQMMQGGGMGMMGGGGMMGQGMSGGGDMMAKRMEMMEKRMDMMQMMMRGGMNAMQPGTPPKSAK